MIPDFECPVFGSPLYLTMGMNSTNYKNKEAINTIIMAVKKRICYKDRLKTHDPATIKSIIEVRKNVEKYLKGLEGGTHTTPTLFQITTVNTRDKT